MTEATFAEAIFNVRPQGLPGMGRLAEHLNGLLRAGKISDWHPSGPVPGANGTRYAVRFATRHDAVCATKRWKPARKGNVAAADTAAVSL